MPAHSAVASGYMLLESVFNILGKVNDLPTIWQVALGLLIGFIVVGIFNQITGNLKVSKRQLARILAQYNNELNFVQTDISNLHRRLNTIEVVGNDLPFAYWHSDLNNRLVWFNPSFAERFIVPLGLASEETPGMNCYDLLKRSLLLPPESEFHITHVERDFARFDGISDRAGERRYTLLRFNTNRFGRHVGYQGVLASY